MLEAIRSTWGIAPDAETTTEANPDTVNEYYIGKLAEAGFTRISFGMQSAVPHVLRTLDRTHTPANVEAGVAAAAKAGLRSSVDLIYGAPGESLDDWRTSVETAIGLGVNHISAYALTVEPTTKMGRQIKAGILPKPNDDDEAAKYEIADEAFSAAGLSWYEVSNWAMRAGTIWGIGAMSTGLGSGPVLTPTTTRSRRKGMAMMPTTPSRLRRQPPPAGAAMGCPAAATMGRTGCAVGISPIRGCGAWPSTRAACRGPAAKASPPRRTSRRSSCWGCASARALTLTESTGKRSAMRSAHAGHG